MDESKEMNQCTADLMIPPCALACAVAEGGRGMFK